MSDGTDEKSEPQIKRSQRNDSNHCSTYIRALLLVPRSRAHPIYNYGYYLFFFFNGYCVIFECKFTTRTVIAYIIIYMYSVV